MINKECKECEWKKGCERCMSIADFMKYLLETHSIPVIYECPLHRKLEGGEQNEGMAKHEQV